MVGVGSAVSAVVGATTVALPPRGGFQGELPCVQHPSCRMHTLTHSLSSPLSGGSKVAIGTSVARLGSRGHMARFGECASRPSAHTAAT